MRLTLPRLLLAAPLMAAALAAARPIEAYVAPLAMFPPEGNYQDGEPSPLVVYDSTRRRTVGLIKRRKPCGPQEECAYVFELELSAGGKTQRLEVAEWRNETVGLLSYRPSLPAADGQRWSSLETPLGQFWLRTKSDDIHRYEALVHVVERPLVWCLSPGKCTAVNSTTALEIERVASQVSCYASPYQVTGIKQQGGRRYYQLELAEPLPDGLSTRLPRKPLVPTRDARGGHTGTFYARGC